MKPAKRTTKKVVKAPAAAKNITGVDLEYVNEVIDDAVSTMMAMRALIGILVEKLEDRDAR